MTNPFSITELASLTHKSRPSLYKYISAYDAGKFDDIPYSFVELFKKMEDPSFRRADLIAYCESAFAEVKENRKLKEVIDFLTTHQKDIDFDALLAKLKEQY